MFPTTIYRFAASLLAALPVLGLDCTGIRAIHPNCPSPETAYIRDVFFISGSYAPYTTNQSIFSGQIMVERLTPLHGVNRTYPLLLISAGVPSGTVWLNTPDNRRGWASYFLDVGYQVYILDITANGRSGQNDLASFPLRIPSTDVITENGFTAPELFGGYPQAEGHTQWPGNGTRGDPVFDAFTASMVPLTSDSTSGQLSMQKAGCELLGMIGETYTICHSIGCAYTALMADQCPGLMRGNINLEPGNIPFQSLIGNTTVASVGRTVSRAWGLTDVPLRYHPEIASASELSVVEVGVDTPGMRSCLLQAENGTVHTLPEIAKVPYVMYTASASPHITYDHCMAAFLNQTGVPNEWIKLGDLGIEGNGHFLHLEMNNLEIARVVEERIWTMQESESGW